MTQRKAPWSLTFGANLQDNGSVCFRVWAPFVREMEVKLLDEREGIRYVPMIRKERGCFEADVEGISAGILYLYRLDGGEERPDPYSRCQPEGVHGPSQVVDPSSFDWSETDWRGIPLKDLIIYELHTGTFTKEGTFEAILPHLDYLRYGLGVTAIEIMPVAAFPGRWNWGYDGVYRFAPQHGYGGPNGLKQLVDACHQIGLVVIADVVYNHAGPEGNYLREFGPYFTDKYKTPWGDAVNYDGPGSDFVRQYVIDNARYWLSEFQIDALRLDAIHTIYDFSEKHILLEIREEVDRLAERLGKAVYLISESDLNDPKIIQPPERGGYGHDALWGDDFHHSLHTLLTGEREGYYQDFGRLEQFAKVLREGFALGGVYSHFRDRTCGRRSENCPPSSFVVFAQNHDQIGNRVRGDRLSALVSFEAQKLAATAVLLSPNLPLLFMGEEYGETAPFPFFTDFQDRALAEAVRKGRVDEATRFGWRDDVSDPQSEETFLRSKIDPPLHHKGPLFLFYQRLIALRKNEPALHAGKRIVSMKVYERAKCLTILRGEGADTPGFVWMILSFNSGKVSLPVQIPSGRWKRRLDSQEKSFGGVEGALLPPALKGDRQQEIVMTPYQVGIYRRDS